MTFHQQLTFIWLDYRKKKENMVQSWKAFNYKSQLVHNVHHRLTKCDTTMHNKSTKMGQLSMYIRQNIKNTGARN